MFNHIFNFLEDIENEKFSNDPVRVRFWEQCLRRAFHNKTLVCVPNVKSVKVDRGQFVLIKNRLAGTIGTSVRTLNKCLDYFENVERKIYVKKHSLYSIVNINNFDDFIKKYGGQKKARKSRRKNETKTTLPAESVDTDLFPNPPEEKQKRKRKPSFTFDEKGVVQGITENHIQGWIDKHHWSREQVEARIKQCSRYYFFYKDKYVNLKKCFDNWMQPKPHWNPPDTPDTYDPSKEFRPSKNSKKFSRVPEGNQITEAEAKEFNEFFNA